MLFRSDCKAPLIANLIAILDAVAVIPAILVEAIADQRCAQNEPNLGRGHTGLELINHLLVDQIALLHVDAIDAWKTQRLAAYNQAQQAT